ncbi:hypothetical protein [Henriciella sp.]|uniref:hypothetical protein n=1 Tax=Henriciella sp. TaxID=1968823 RepID=UPI00261CFD6D|nr:hypothetical protein [Henriciella sp.]
MSNTSETLLEPLITTSRRPIPWRVSIDDDEAIEALVRRVLEAYADRDWTDLRRCRLDAIFDCAPIALMRREIQQIELTIEMNLRPTVPVMGVDVFQDQIGPDSSVETLMRAIVRNVKRSRPPA